jgi:hypothetical protein
MQEVGASKTDTNLRMIAQMQEALRHLQLSTTPALGPIVQFAGRCRWPRYHPTTHDAAWALC